MSQTKEVRGTATHIGTENGDTVIRYHDTDVVRFNGAIITLNTGGYKTVTTKRRMNQASEQFSLGYAVFQRGGDWFVDFQGKTYPFADTRMTLARYSMELCTVSLAEMVETLERVGCQFWACDGYETPPQDMVTCHCCEVLYRLKHS